jgi:hypothetical protein
MEATRMVPAEGALLAASAGLGRAASTQPDMTTRTVASGTALLDSTALLDNATLMDGRLVKHPLRDPGRAELLSYLIVSRMWRGMIRDMRYVGEELSGRYGYHLSRFGH